MQLKFLGLPEAAEGSWGPQTPPVTNHGREFFSSSSKVEDLFQMWAVRCCYHVLQPSQLFTNPPHTHTQSLGTALDLPLYSHFISYINPGKV